MNQLWEFRQGYNVGAVGVLGNKDKMIRFGGQNVRGHYQRPSSWFTGTSSEYLGHVCTVCSTKVTPK